MKHAGFTLRALLHVLAEYLMVFPLLFLLSGLMPGNMPLIFLLSALAFALFGVLLRRCIPVAWLQLAIGLPLCIGAALWLGMTFGSRAEPATYAIPAILAPFLFYRGKQHGQNDWNAILPTYAPCVIMVFNFLLMALVNYLGRFARFVPVITPMGILSLIVSFYAMNYINRCNLADHQRAAQNSSTAVSRSLSLQNSILTGIFMGLGALLSCMPWLLTAARYLLKAAGFILGLILDLIFSLVPPLTSGSGASSSSDGFLQGESNPGWDGFFKIIANIFFVLIVLVFVVLLFLALRKGLRLLSQLLHNMLEQKGYISGDSDSFEDTHESIVNLRDLPRKYYNDLKDRLSSLRRGQRWSELTTESERIRYLYRHSLKRAEKVGYRHDTAYTPHEALGEAAQELPQIQPVQSDLAAQYDVVRYAEREPQPGDAERIREQSGL